MLQTNLKGPLTVALAVIGGSLVVGLAGVLLLGSWLDSEAGAMRAKRFEVAQASTVTPRLNALRAQEPQAAAYSRIFALLLPKQDELLEVPRVIESRAQSFGVGAQFKFQGSPLLDATGATPLPFALSATGAPSQLVAYLKDIEADNPRYIISLGNIQYTAMGDGQAQVTVPGNLYYQP